MTEMFTVVASGTYDAATDALDLDFDVVTADHNDGHHLLCQHKDRDPRVAQAAAHVSNPSRFYPPLPEAYGQVAVDALDDIEGVITLPEGLEPRPRLAYWVDGVWKIRATDVIDILHLWHMVDSDED